MGDPIRMNAEEAGALLGRSRTTILRWYAEGRLAGESYLSRVTFAREDVERIKTTGKIPNPAPRPSSLKRAAAGSR